MDTENELLPNESDRIVCVKVGFIKRENLYEMTRKYWKMNLERVSLATHVLAIVDGKVKAVYIPQKWYYTQESQYLRRVEFNGIEDPDSTYIGKSVKTFYGRSANPVKYINM
ncbi:MULTISPECIES: hypothetical protein [unclassified Prevotella]|uniref:hypothetical protein n=1 Tax=unclassified Prevotella TaxID=2638335 RepID=UPI00055E7145|nr:MULTISPECIES: hypothetical protein [unclassified Prevotella]SEW18143.1 hypothetical protein SAMN04487827_2046 [Prevotella sp. khp7]